MAYKHATPGDVMDLSTFGESQTTALVKTPQFEAIRIVMQPGRPIPAHKVDGPITVQCLSGECTFLVGDESRQLVAGSWLFLTGGTMHALESQEPCVLLVTILLN